MNRPLSRMFKRFADFWLGEKGLSAFLFLLFVALFLGAFTDSKLVHMVTSLFLSLLMVAGVVNMSSNRAIRLIAGIIACAAIVLRWLTHFTAGMAIVRWSSITALVFMILLTSAILYQVFMDDKPVTGYRIRGAIAAYLLFGITWSILYTLLDQTLPHAFNLPAPDGLYGAKRQEDITYFSFVTLATLGYGDITPTHVVSRMFAVTEALVGQLYPATLLARLVSLEVAHRGG